MNIDGVDAPSLLYHQHANSPNTPSPSSLTPSSLAAMIQLNGEFINKKGHSATPSHQLQQFNLMYSGMGGFKVEVEIEIDEMEDEMNEEMVNEVEVEDDEMVNDVKVVRVVNEDEMAEVDEEEVDEVVYEEVQEVQEVEVEEVS